MTSKPRDYDGDGTPDKMWALGRSNKENIVFLRDSLTAYFGIDDSNYGFLFKFIANQKANFSSGTLYVLTSSTLLSATGTWVQVPNTTQADRNNSQSIANGLGARNYTRIEDVEIGPDGMIYFAATSSGRIYRLQDNGMTISNFEIYIQGNQSYTYTTATGAQTTTFSAADNLAFDNEGNLWINCDGGCSPIWVAMAGHTMSAPKMELFARTPSGSESTGITFSPDGRFMFLSIQHPNTGNTTQVIDAAGNPIVFNRSTTIVMGRKEHLGADAAIPFVDLGPEVEVCANQEVVLDPGSGFAAYLWSTGAITQSIVATTPGLYTVQVTGLNGRTNTASVEITHLDLPVISVDANPVSVCQGANVTLTANGANTYVWSNGVVNGVAFEPTQTADYTVVGTGMNGCSNSAVVTVVVNDLPNVNAVASQNELCIGSSLTLSGTGALTYSWDNNVIDGVAFEPTITTVYNVTGTDVNGCVSSGQVNVLIHELPTVSATATANEICSGDEVTLHVVGSAATYSWNNGVINGTAFEPTGTNTYTVTGTSEEGCENSASIQVVVNDLPIVSLTGLNSTYLNTDPNVDLVGSPTGGVFSGTGVSNNTFSPSLAGAGGPYTITYVYTDPTTGCSNSSESFVLVEQNSAGLIEINGTGAYKVYPNPFTENLAVMINAYQAGTVTLKITSIDGKEVFFSRLSIESGVTTVEVNDLREWSSGVYSLSLEMNGTITSQRIIKK
jgi:sugar lactone lactonase YvrE